MHARVYETTSTYFFHSFGKGFILFDSSKVYSISFPMGFIILNPEVVKCMIQKSDLEICSLKNVFNYRNNMMNRRLASKRA